MNAYRRLAAALVITMLGSALPATAQIRSGDNPEGSEVWKKLRASLFQSRSISIQADNVLALDTPLRAEDAAIVPISIKTKLAQTPGRYISKIYLIIDQNPSPLSAVFEFTPDSGRADIETRVRIDEYTHVRAVAEMNDGKLYAATRFVKASGGCSAPPGKDQQAALATLGRMKFNVVGDLEYNKPVLAQLMISHPNNSGLAMDQATRQYTPAHFVRKIDISYGGRPVMSADLDFSISENPNFRFYFIPRGEGQLKAEVVDSKDLRFDTAVKIRTGH